MKTAPLQIPLPHPSLAQQSVGNLDLFLELLKKQGARLRVDIPNAVGDYDTTNFGEVFILYLTEVLRAVLEERLAAL